MRPEAEVELRAFVTARGPALYRTAFLLVGDAHDAEDLAQATLVEVIGAWQRIRRVDAPEVYARRVLVNLAARRWRRLRMHADIVARQDVPPPAPDPSDDAVLRDVVGVAVRSLPMRMRAVVVLRFYDDLSVAETAAVLGVSTGTVKSQSSKALAHLRVRLNQSDFPLTTAGCGGDGPFSRGSQS